MCKIMYLCNNLLSMQKLYLTTENLTRYDCISNALNYSYWKNFYDFTSLYSKSGLIPCFYKTRVFPYLGLPLPISTFAYLCLLVVK